jgi:excisionase family DNA binding protein
MSPAGGPDPRIMTTSEVAKWLYLTEPTITQHIQRGLIPASRLGSEWRFWRPLLISRLFPEAEQVSSDESDPDIITIEELADRLRLSVPTVRMRIEDQSIPASRIGKIWRIYWPTIRDRLAEGKDFAPPQH